MLKLTNVSKNFGKIKALENISFEVADGEFVFLTGPSGAGKTSILRLILREFLPSNGTIEFDGQDITKLPRKKIPELRQKIGVIFQDFKVLPERTVRENIEVALALKNIPDREWSETIKELLSLVGLDLRANLFPSQLSGGELQRLALARALSVSPKLILADEPTGNLDWKTADTIMDLLLKINKEGKTIIMATHHKLIVDKMKKRTIKLKEGRMIIKDD
ncbi:hypothetical protein A3D00_05555 [Candidatus Woesebacteria bacterium RIFCSPHIGHO2_02_FULL_38_9]|uniref:ABC transporter domain-containing protein n=1 Tax=Candidatus Woesebacteria bacterium RIFCSPHIGHO2_01_FULL_39_28 TaxID=1802496 RepID=A0A1F7YKM9_9BACT|nr:MAG: hypothetical protein A2627_05935 [Candidatus Woesebacteria bacterium RIFCSPHIGHO2_01_FULL_39_28]OGM32020.1 MAG: hypothetical protein A3D00_05555 [Candidatus Woesebacteria bacterium RIFCSPHIGHO2_02_FULL_38_9]OGM57127.1 MAG: hypothetical protein A3A50_00345 [Candidatus Woesebacteria bacterium RIFCSPLOWO2_01_FULL_38_20]